MTGTWSIFRFGVICAVAIPALVGCGSSSSSGGTSATLNEAGAPGTTPLYQRSTASIVACAHAGKAIALPKTFPRQFPFPRGSAITKTGTQFGATTISGFVPSRNFASSLHFFMTSLPAAGFHIGDHDAEPPREGEGEYVGHGYIGRFKIHSIAGCSGALTLEASATHKPPAK